MNLRMKIKFENKTIVDAKGNNIKDFDPILNELKHKFDGKGRRSK